MSMAKRGRVIAAGLLTGAFAAAAWAGAIQFGPVDKALGDAPVALAVSIGDRVVGVIQATDPAVLGWFDTQDWRDDAVQNDLAGAVTDMRCIEAAGDSSDPILLVGGSAVSLVHVDGSTAPATLGFESAFGLDGDTVAALAWDADREIAYGADDAGSRVHWIPVTGAGGAVDTEAGWPLVIPDLTPIDLTMVDADTLLVIGNDADTPKAALVDVSTSPPTWQELELPAVSGAAVAVDSDPDAALGWILLADGTLIELVGESVGDDDDSVGDDDDSAGDDDDSAGDDDDSAGDDDDSAMGARADSWTTRIVTTNGPSPATDLVQVGGLVHVLGEAVVDSIDLATGESVASFALTSPGSAIAASSASDGLVYVALRGTGQISILSAGPFVDITDVSTTALSSTAASIDVTFTAGDGIEEGTCTWNLVLDGTITLQGTLLEATGDAILGEATTITVPGTELIAGNHRVFVVCTDADGDRGRASFPYYMGDLSAPADFAVQPADARVLVSWTDADDENVDHYVVHFSDSEFAVGTTPTSTTTDGNTASGFSVALPTTLGATVSTEVSPLANDTTYWFAVAAVDADGAEGPRTQVLSATPGVTGGVAAITGDPGCSCNTSSPTPGPRGVALLLALGLPLFALARRRPRGIR